MWKIQVFHFFFMEAAWIVHFLFPGSVFSLACFPLFRPAGRESEWAECCVFSDGWACESGEMVVHVIGKSAVVGVFFWPG